MWIIIHQNALELCLDTLATGTTLVLMISRHPGFLSLLGFGSLHRISVYEHYSRHSSEKT